MRSDVIKDVGTKLSEGIAIIARSSTEGARIVGTEVSDGRGIKVPEVKEPEFKAPEVKVPKLKAPNVMEPEVSESFSNSRCKFYQAGSCRYGS